MKLKISYIKLFLLLLIVTYSCKNNKDNFEDYKNCINESLSKKIKALSVFDSSLSNEEISIFDTITNLENQLISNKLLKEKNSKSYLELLDKLSESKTDSILKVTLNENDFLFDVTRDVNMTIMFIDSCPKTANLSRDIKETLFEIIEEGYPTQEILKKLVKINKENNETFRMTICYLFFIHLKSKDIKMPEPVF